MKPTDAIIQPGTRVRITAEIDYSADRRLKFKGNVGIVQEFRSANLDHPNPLHQLPPYLVWVRGRKLWLTANEFEVA